MIERKFINENKKEFLVEEFIRENLKGVGHSKTKTKKTPLGEKVIIYSSRPGLVVGRGGSNIKKLTKQLKTKFHLENPQIEISEVDNVNLDSQLVAERIATSLEKFGAKRFKGIMHKSMTDVMRSGAKGIEILLSGRVPSSRARTWRVNAGYLKKCGDIALTGVDIAKMQANLKIGSVGIVVKIMPPGTRLPDHVEILDGTEYLEQIKIEELKVEAQKEKVAKKSTTKKVTKRAPRKTTKKETKVEIETKSEPKSTKVVEAPKVTPKVE